MTISSHVLDASVGRPAAGVAVEVYRRETGGWTLIGSGSTGRDGRATDFGAAPDLEPAEYRLVFDTGAYFRGRGVESFYGRIPIDFIAVDGAAHYHVPLLVSPFGYSTYRGS
ncbi:MAG TPA: hydroxyisourate hydrolase [Vicinamibacterales bacterium]|jgi:5-hydroxyisourate hydrolase